MALHHARDLYTRRNEGVSIWVVAAEDITASSPDEKDPFFAPSRRQGVPAPDVLRHPRRRPAHVRRYADERFDNAYEALADDDGRRPPLGVRHRLRRPARRRATPPCPSGVDAEDLATYCLMLGDDALIFSHRLQQWVTHAPELEEEIALANIALDLLGQARLLLARAGKADGTGRDEDALAFFRAEHEFRNVAAGRTPPTATSRSWSPGCWCSRPGGWRCSSGLRDSRDPVLAAIAAKGVKELTYHRDYAAQWVVRLGDGTELSHRADAGRARERLAAASTSCSPRTTVERRLAAAGVGVDPADAARRVRRRARRGARRRPRSTGPRRRRPLSRRSAGRAAATACTPRRSGYVLAEMQSVARAHPDATW